MGQPPDSADSAAALFAAYGAHLVDAKGDITVRSDATHQVITARALRLTIPQSLLQRADDVIR